MKMSCTVQTIGDKRHLPNSVSLYKSKNDIKSGSPPPSMITQADNTTFISSQNNPNDIVATTNLKNNLISTNYNANNSRNMLSTTADQPNKMESTSSTREFQLSSSEPTLSSCQRDGIQSETGSSHRHSVPLETPKRDEDGSSGVPSNEKYLAFSGPQYKAVFACSAIQNSEEISKRLVQSTLERKVADYNR